MEVLALYLPQFHPIPENDEWWGPGFTEWTNVTGATSLFRGHVQPHLPADLGFTDLRLSEVREAQADLARTYGITGFCYWHYWFAGRRLLERPFAEVRTSGRPDFPFCLSWANQSWSGIWHGAPNRILIEQTYPGPTDDDAHFAELLPAFVDDRYIRIDGRPVFFVYQPGSLPNASEFVETWQRRARHAGLAGLYLIASLGESNYRSWQADGFDSAVVYQYPFARDLPTWIRLRLQELHLVPGPTRYPYGTPAPLSGVEGPTIPAIYPNWDNTPRSGRRGFVATGSTPEAWRLQVRRGLADARRLPEDRQVLVIKSWNEWAEGNYLEPDLETGRARLEVLSEELARLR